MTPPLEIELGILGGVLIDPKVLAVAAAILRPSDFAREPHRRIFEALLKLETAGKPIDAVTLRHELHRDGALEAAGGGAFIGSLLDGRPRTEPAAIAAWAREVKESSRLRGLADQLRRLLVRVEEPDATAQEIAEAIQDVALSPTATIGGVLDRREVARGAWRLLEEEVTGKATGVPTGLPSLDRRLRFGGWRPGQVVYIGARTSRGKSALLLAHAEAAAAHDKRVLVFSLEMSAEELGVRRLVAEAGVGLRALYAWRQSEREYAIGQLQRVAHILDRPLDFAHPNVRTLAGIRTECRRAKARGLDLVVIDYLGLIRDDSKRERSIYEKTTIASQGIKALAMELEVPVLCAVQLNREMASQGKTKPTRPTLAHFRDSGAIEQDADVALLIHQDSTVDAIREGPCELVIAKQRNGSTGTVPLTWNATCARFEEPEEAA